MPNLIATKSMTYGTRRLVADDIFTAGRRDARVLVAIGKARLHDDDAKPAPAPASAPARKADDIDDVIASLRAEYQDKVGKRPYHGWNAGELRLRIYQATGRRAGQGTPSSDD